MIKPDKTENEAGRLKDLDSYDVFDTLSEKEYEEITSLAAFICQVPISQISLIGETQQWIKAETGSKSEGYIDRNYTVCGHAISKPQEILVVPDLRTDERFHDNPVLINAALVFYAGVPLVTPEGFALGTLCVLDHEPKQLSQHQLETLKALANQVMQLLQLRKSRSLLQQSVQIVEEKNRELERFAYVVAHDIKSPLNNMSGLTKHLIKRHGANLPPEVTELLGMIDASSTQVKELVDGILEYSRTENYLTENTEELPVESFLKEIVHYFDYHKDCEFVICCTCPKITANKPALSQILLNLISNAIKYNDKKNVVVEIAFTGTSDNYSFSVKDNGPGIKQEYQHGIFEMFKVFSESDRFGKRGNGIGLATVKKLIEKLSGTIQLESQPGHGTMFTVQFGA